MIYGSVCSGIEAATIAWHPIGWSPAWFSEIKPFPCRLLKHYYPNTPNLGDMLKLHEKKQFIESNIDVLVGGTPCQSFSTAGLRGGLSDPRGNLALQFCRILAVKRPRFFVWENVPGVLSVEGGSAFRSIIAGFSECGYSIAWRILDAQFFGVPQRRRRVFVVGYLGNDWRPPAAVLFEPKGLRGYSAQGGTPGQNIAGTLTSRTKGRGAGVEEAANNCMVVADNIGSRVHADRGAGDTNNLILGRHGTMTTGQGNTEILIEQVGTLNCNHEQPIVFPINTQIGLREHKDGDGTRLGVGDASDPAFTLQGAHGHAIVCDGVQITSWANKSNPQPGDPAPTIASGSKLFSIMPMNSGKDYKAREVEMTQPLTTQSGVSSDQDGNVVLKGATVRRLTPMECERLQGFPDGYTAIPGASDSARYEAIGNSMAVPVMAWIGRQIDKYDKIF